MHKTVFLYRLLLLVALCLPGWAQQVPSTAGSIGDYVRYQKTPPARLETSVVTMQAPAGQKLDLIAALHVAEPDYYKDLNDRFKGYDAVLYELILPEEMAGQSLPASLDSGGGVSGMQGMLARSLGLATQMSNVDYSPKNFVHADLTREGLARSMKARQESFLTYFQRMMMASGAMNTGSYAELGVTEKELAGVDFMSLFTGTPSAQDRKIFKKLMATMMSSPNGMLAALGDTALLGERNKTAIGVVDKQIGKGRKNLALFYGAAHMPDLEARLKQKGWKRVNTAWLPAWNM